MFETPLFSLSFPLIPSFFFHLLQRFQHGIFLLLLLLFLHLAFILLFSLWLQLVKDSFRSCCISVLYFWLGSSRSVVVLSGAPACVNVVCFPLITCPWTWLKSQNICVHSPLLPTCLLLYVSVFCFFFFSFSEAQVYDLQNVTIPLPVCNWVLNNFIQPVFDIPSLSNTEVLFSENSRGDYPGRPSLRRKNWAVTKKPKNIDMGNTLSWLWGFVCECLLSIVRARVWAGRKSARVLLWR